MFTLVTLGLSGYATHRDNTDLAAGYLVVAVLFGLMEVVAASHILRAIWGS